jgi:RNA polymerase sigma-70 factor (ECF subfamily)
MGDVRERIREVLPHLQRYAIHLTKHQADAEDLVQDCLARALLKADLYRPGTNYRAWLFTIMHNLFSTQGRRRRAAAQHLAELTHSAERTTAPPQHAVVVLNRTLSGLDKLSSEERQAVVLLCVQQLSYRDVARSTGVPIGTIKSRVSRGRERLRADVLGVEG